MLAKDLVSDPVPVVSKSDSVNRVLETMLECRVSHLPVADHLEYFGLIAEKTIKDIADKSVLLEQFASEILPLSAIETQHIY